MASTRHNLESMKRQLFSALVLAGILASGACYEDDPATAPSKGIRTQIMLTDAPFPYDSVRRVDLYIVSIAASTGTDTTDQPGGPEWITVAEPKQRYNLLDLQRGVTDTVGETLLPAGAYRSLRMIINTDSSSITSKYGHKLPVNWGFSAGQPRLYALVEGYNVTSGDSARIVIDFDVGRSFWPLEGGNSFLFLPVMRAVNEAATGSIMGTVRGDTLAADPAPIGDVTITVFSGNPAAPENTWSVRATGRTTPDGEYMIPFLMPGTYVVRSDAPRISPFGPGVKSGVTVTRGVTTRNVDITLPARTAVHLTVLPSAIDLPVGGMDTLQVYATDLQGQIMNGAAFTWTSSDPSTVSVQALPGNSSSALVTGHKVGGTVVQVCHLGDCLDQYVSVGQRPRPASVATITINPPSVTLHALDSVSIAATLRDSAGNVLTSRDVYWATSDSAVVGVWGSGRVITLRAFGPGTATVRAMSEGKEATVPVTVVPKP